MWTILHLGQALWLLYASLCGHKIVCHARHQTMPEFLLNPYDMDETHINRFTEMKPAGKAVLTLGHFTLDI